MVAARLVHIDQVRGCGEGFSSCTLCLAVDMFGYQFCIVFENWIDGILATSLSGRLAG